VGGAFRSLFCCEPYTSLHLASKAQIWRSATSAKQRSNSGPYIGDELAKRTVNSTAQLLGCDPSLKRLHSPRARVRARAHARTRVREPRASCR